MKKTTKLLTIFLIANLYSFSQLQGQCSLITANGSSQDPKTVCAPVDFTMNVWYKFLIPVDPSRIEILFVWNDGTTATTTLPGTWNASLDSVWAEASHIYPPSDECARTAEAYLVYDGERCTSSGRQEQTFSTWGTDEENGGVLTTDPVVYYVCEGEDIVNVTFDDNSTFNCNIFMEPDNPNRYFRWVQFIYGTYSTGGPRIPNVTIEDNGGTIHNMTDGAGNSMGTQYGPIEMIPIPADGPNQTSFPISAPAGGVAGDIFEITMLNWNVCNPYDDIPTDGIPPADPVNGDNPAIRTTARIEIIAPPPVVTSNSVEFCTGDDFLLTASAPGATIRWYQEAGLTTLLHTGNNFRITDPPTNIDNSIPGNYSFYVTSYDGQCESAPDVVNITVHETPNPAIAGPDQLICADTITLTTNIPSAGSAIWTTGSSAVISNPLSSTTFVSNLEHGPNTFTWTITNGPCVTSDEVIITSDRQPDPAQAGIDQSFCDASSINLNADSPTNNGIGTWRILQGSGTFSDSTNSNAVFNNPDMGYNRLMWRVSSRYSGCLVTTDTVEYLNDLSPGIANAGIDARVCELSTFNLNGVPPTNSGTGYWRVLSGGATLVDSTSASSQVNNLSIGPNHFEWNLESQYGICPSSSDTVEIIQDESPGIANAGPDKLYCFELQDTLQGNAPIAGSGQWEVLNSPVVTPPSFAPDNAQPNALFSIAPGNEGRYTLEWRLVNGSCRSRDTVILDFGIPTPPADAGPDTIICGSSYQLQGNSFPIGSNFWRQISGPGIVDWSPDSTQYNSTVSLVSGNSGNYRFEWNLVSGSCPSTRDTVEINFNVNPDNPQIDDVISCGPDSVYLELQSPQSGVEYLWYQTNTDTVEFRKGITYQTPLIIVDKSYCIRGIDTITNCKSDLTEVEIQIEIIPDSPILYGDTLCGSGTAVLYGLAPTPSSVVEWFSDKATTSYLESGSIINVDIIADSWVYTRTRDTITNCVSPMDSVFIKVWPEVPVPIALADSSCGASSFVIHATKSDPGNLLFWYDSIVDGTILNINDSLITPTINQTTSYWVAEYDPVTQCFSSRLEVDRIIHMNPEVPVLSDTSSCGASSFTLVPEGGFITTTFRWYNLPIMGNLISQSDTYTTPLLAGNTSYYVSGYNEITGCEGDKAQVDIAIYPIPAPTSISGPTIVLKDQSNVIFSTNGLPGSLFNWTIPSGINLEQNMNDFVRLGFPSIGDYTISVQETSSDGCPGTLVSHPIKVIHDSILVDIGTYNQNACTGVDYQIKPWLFGGTPPYTYNWTGDTEYLSTTTSLFTTFTPPGTGVFRLYVEVADVNLKTTRDSVILTVHESPTVSILNTDTIVCIGKNYQINTQWTGFSPFTYLWTGPIQHLNAYNIPNPVFSPKEVDTMQYEYILTDVNGCKAWDSIILVTDRPTAAFNILTEPGCSPLYVEFENNSTDAVGYYWDFNDGNVSTEYEPKHLYENNSPEIKYYAVSLEVESTLGCKDTAIQYQMVWPNPVATLNILPEAGCNPVNALLVSTPGNSTYTWNYGDGNNEVLSAFNTSHLFLNEGLNDTVYQLSVITKSSLNCYDTAYASIAVYAKPDVNYMIDPVTQEYPDNSFQLINNTIGNWSYMWNFGNGIMSDKKDPGSVEYEAPGNYTISLVASSNHCTDSASVTAYLLPAPPVASFKGADPGCQPHTVTLVNNSEFADSYLWEFGDGNISTAKEPTYTYYDAGIYKIKLTVKGDGGEDIFSDTTRVYILPHSFFDLAPRYVYVNDEAVHYFNLSDHGRIYEWDFGDGTNSTELNPKHIYKKAGNYDVTLKVWTENGCFDLYVMENAVMVEPSGQVEFPNAFRPNSPIEENRVFKPGIIDHVEEYHLMIFNRWGELIFESFDQETGWDGYYKGKIAKQDVYVWKVKGTYSDGKGFTKSGNVTLLY